MAAGEWLVARLKTVSRVCHFGQQIAIGSPNCGFSFAQRQAEGFRCKLSASNNKLGREADVRGGLLE